MIKVIGFDLDDTLWALTPIILRAEKRLDKWLQENVPQLKYDVIQMRELREELLLESPELGGQVTELRRRIIARAMLHSSVSEAAIGELSTAAMEIFLTARNDIEFFEGALEAISLLSESYVLGALTNGNADVSRLGLAPYFSFAFSAEQIGAPKPAPDLFTHALAHTDVDPHQMIYVGDDPVLDIDTANGLGLRTIWVNTKQKDKSGETNPDITIENIKDLPKAVSQIVQSA
ncbi:MAG TPA: hypothetical protein DCM54_06005 [Gammaproteobacteria bacterium]|nr:hypothetical protein [Gammaproteobacteria bacterium]